MDLFTSDPNILPYDGEVLYHGPILPQEEARMYYDTLLSTIPWQHDEAVIYGKRIVTKRKVAWYGDEKYAYTYSNTTKHALPWTKELLELKAIAEKMTGIIFNSCLMNLYHDGNEGMAWHSDDEKALGKDTVIASISLGAERKFMFKHKKTGEKREIILQNGSLLVMKGATQTNWLHRLPPSVKIKHPRINLTFRTIVPGPAKTIP
ncbi:alpha-ketoglutarate-dependent dioxygenase AlkB [Flavobacterium sp. MFBS3-15]|uniref:alpha-ketoglutarate-dependent dioxygenase AlkB family protein n=1 Tax=Flavobacterium sp. MFBS3-15 TaxID=2989816 RepID=UPI002235DB38|nr:alpha-ketoglutarate-dependent dioxygenase AlkB [Flavobacterium sp. MFBS3-15]MCW4467423.1 alpha-ketoglutarate-dependent dioxygenase AlkB [Flavobacterium sp. MFBS3-15]